MPTRQVTGYGNVMFPDSMSEKDIESAVRRLEAEGKPGLISRGVSAAMKPITDVVAGGLQSLMAGGGAPEAFSLPILDRAFGTTAAPSGAYQITPEARVVAAQIVPQTPTDIGIAAGTLAAGPFGPAARVLGGAMGGTTGAYYGGDRPEAGALQGTIGTLGGEVIGAGAGFLRKALPGRRTAIGAHDLGNVLDEAARFLPGVRPDAPPTEIKRLFRSGTILNQLGDEYVASVAEATRLIGNNKINVPTLAGPAMPVKDATAMLKNHGYGQTAIPAAQAINLSRDAQAILAGRGPLTADQAAQALHAAGFGRPKLTLSEAVETLKAFGYAGFSGVKEQRPERTFAGRMDRETWEKALGEIKAELRRFNPTGEAEQVFEAGRTKYTIGRTLHNLLAAQGSWIGNPNEVRPNLNNLRALYEQKYPKLINAMTDADRQAFEQVLYRDAPFGSRDVIGRGPDSLKAAGSQLLRSGGGSATGMLAPLRTLLPGGGDLYTGATPSTLGPGAKTAVDLLSQRLYNLAAPSHRGQQALP